MMADFVDYMWAAYSEIIALTKNCWHDKTATNEDAEMFVWDMRLRLSRSNLAETVRRDW